MDRRFAAHEIDAMRRALQLAARGGPATSPNPQVGCVLLDPTGATVGEGWHRRVGGPHAEVEALTRAGDAARGGTAVVTLEPCDHTGRTGPCTAALLRAGITRVVYAVADPASHADPADEAGRDGHDDETDPHPRPGHGGFAIAGSAGARTLAAAGVDVVGGLLADEAVELNREWFLVLSRGRPHRPYLTYKYAATLDGRVAAADGSSRWITSAEARADVHRVRAESDAVLVGSGTVRADDPQLAVRGRPDARQPLRVVVDTTATAIRPDARVLDEAAPTLVAVADDLPPGATAHLDGKARILRVPRSPTGGLRLDALLTALHDRGVVRLLVEGGPTLAGALLRAGLVDRVLGYLAPALLGDGPAALRDAGIGTLTEAPRLRIVEAVPIGPDLRITAEQLPDREHPGQPGHGSRVGQGARLGHPGQPDRSEAVIGRHHQ